MELIYNTGQWCESRVKNAILSVSFFLLMALILIIFISFARMHLRKFQKCPYMFVFKWKYYPKTFACLILRILKYFAHKLLFFFKSGLLFSILYCLCMFWNKYFAHFTIMKGKFSGHYFNRKSNIGWCFKIFISVPLFWYQVFTTEYQENSN